ncbi:uncharacterized protein G2W53_038034 [Senna tora]|uniref:Uncharacterized protein n=1 Tax=Senna tora TaxID=362788 RepID=A0A834SNF2_9FABA|nr:uncharacterized protein G2W53_038034 [Senna tora]
MRGVEECGSSLGRNVVRSMRKRDKEGESEGGESRPRVFKVKSPWRRTETHMEAGAVLVL